jgi:hypothetical protein
MRRLAIGIILVVLAAVCPIATGFAQDRVALVVGINSYAKVSRLEKATSDARAVGDTLRHLGFRVDVALDVDRRAFNKAISDFLNKIKPGAIAYFHYSGHGVSINSDTYLIPADMELPTSDDREFVKRESIRLSELIDSLKNAKASARVLVIDACRENPFASRGVRGIGGSGGIALLPSAEGTLILYSAADGQVALDGLGPNDREPTSVYTRTLLKHLAAPGESMVEIARQVRREVEQLAKTVGHEQRPAYYDELSDELRLTAAPASPSAAVAPVASPRRSPAAPMTLPDLSAAVAPPPSSTTAPAPSLHSGTPAPGSLVGINLPGSTMRTIKMSEADPAACQTACRAEGRCAAWTYSEPSPSGAQARCALKAVVPAQVANACCTSGTERAPDPVLNTPPQISATVVGAMRGIDLPGLDYRVFVVTDPDPTVCQAACRADKKCAAWTHVKGGIVGPATLCVLKHGIPVQVASPCCVSGIEKRPAARSLVPGGGKLLAGINLPGLDYYNFQLGPGEPALCQNACRSDELCAAWTYVRPGLQGQQARCWLKSGVLRQAPSTCCTSGIERKMLGRR